MDQTHVHLLMNHLPVIGSVLGAFVLVYGMVAKSEVTKNAAFFIFILCGIGAVITYLTGEAAEETVEHLAGISESVIEDHEDSALTALISMIVLSVASIAALILSSKELPLSKLFSYVVLIAAIISFGIIAYTANLGGKIRHTEIVNSPSAGEKQTPVEHGD